MNNSWFCSVLEEECNEGETFPYDYDGVESVAQMLMDSNSDDWRYMVVGGQTFFEDLDRDNVC